MIVRNGIVSHIQGLLKLILLKCPYYPRQSTHLIKSLSKYPGHFFSELDQITVKFILNDKRPWIIKVNLRRKNRAGDVIFPDFRLYYKATIIQTKLYCHKNSHRSMPQNRESRNKPMNMWDN